MSLFDNWRKDMECAAVLYRMVECKDDKTFDIVDVDTTVDGAFVKSRIQDMYADNLVTHGDTSWVVTDKGRDVLKRLVEVTDLVMKFEIFSSVDLDMQLPASVADPERPGQVYAHSWDPRFYQFYAGPKAEDLRIAMFNFLNEHLSNTPEFAGKKIDPRVIVFLQKLGSGKIKSEGWQFWADLRLGKLFDEVDNIVNSAYKWTDMCPDDLEQAKAYMLGLYEAGMAEQMKRSGSRCSKCNAALAMFEQSANESGTPLTNCPVCNRLLDPPADPVEEYTEVETVTETITEYDCVPGWSYSYDYVPLPYFYPYDPFMDVALFTILADPWW